MAAVRKIGRSGSGGKVLAPHPDELIGASPPVEEQKRPPGLRTRKLGGDTKSPQDGSYASSNLAAVVIRSFQKEKQERRQSFTRLKNGDDSGDDSTPRLVQMPRGDKTLPCQKKTSRSASRGKDPGSIKSMSKEGSRDFSDEKRDNPRRSVSAQPIRECRHREPFDCSSKIVPSVGMSRAVAKAFLKTSASRNERKVDDESNGSGKPWKQNASEQSLTESQAPATVTAAPVAVLEERVSLLEGKVSELESELKDTKELLYASNADKRILEDIQSRVASMEKTFVASKETRRLSEGSGRGLLELPQVLKNRPSLQQKILESRAKLIENKTLLRAKIEALPLRGYENEVIAEEFLASLNQPAAEHEAEAPGSGVENQPPREIPVKLSPASVEKPPTNSSTRKNTSERKRKVAELAPTSSASLKSRVSSDTTIPSGLECDETMASEDLENTAPAALEVAVDMEPKLCPLGTKVAMAGWYVYDGQGILLAHEDGSCSFYDVANMEEKSQYKSPDGVAPASWRDCWLVRAAGADGRSNKYVVAASAGTTAGPAFCSWNFYEKTIAAYHSEDPSWPGTPTIPTPSSGASSSVGPVRSPSSSLEFPLWWYRPCGPLVASAGSGLKALALYDIRDGDVVMKWESSRSIAAMEFSCPIQWRSKTTLLVAEDEGLSVWDISNLEAQRLHSIRLAEKDIYALHIYNSDGECNGGVRQRISSKDCEGVDGYFATSEAVHALDFRIPSGIALKIPVFGQKVHSLFARGNAVYAGVTGSEQQQCSVQQWSIKMTTPMLLYNLPAAAEVPQVWGSSGCAMGINASGLFVFDQQASQPSVVIGGAGLYSPSFDYSSSKVLLISRDRPASWQLWP